MSRLNISIAVIVLTAALSAAGYAAAKGGGGHGGGKRSYAKRPRGRASFRKVIRVSGFGLVRPLLPLCPTLTLPSFRRMHRLAAIDSFGVSMDEAMISPRDSAKGAKGALRQ